MSVTVGRSAAGGLEPVAEDAAVPKKQNHRAPGAVKITLHSANNDIDEKAEVMVVLSNPEEAVDKMLHTLAQRFPPESVMTISPSKGFHDSNADSSSAATESRFSSSDNAATASQGAESSGRGHLVQLSPEIRHGMSGLPAEFTGWILSNDPAILPGLLRLATRGGDAKEFAAQVGLAGEPVETIVNQLSQDQDFFEWVDKIARSTSAARKPPSSLSRSPPKPKSTSSSKRKSASKGRMPGEGSSPVSSRPSAFPESQEPYWITDWNGNIVGHTDSDGSPIMHPRMAQNMFPQQQQGDTRDSLLRGQQQQMQQQQLQQQQLQQQQLQQQQLQNLQHQQKQQQQHLQGLQQHGLQQQGLQSVPIYPTQPGMGSLIVDPVTNRVVGHISPSTGTPIMVPLGPIDQSGGRMSSTLPNAFVVPRDPKRPDHYPWLVDSMGNVFGHVDPQGQNVLYTHSQQRGTSSVAESGLEHVTYEPDGTRVRYVEVPVEETRIRQVFVKEIRQVEKRVPKIEVIEVEKIVEVPEIQYVIKNVDVDVYEDRIKNVVKKEVVEVPQEVLVRVPNVVVQKLEKIVEIPEIIEIPKPFVVKNKVSVARYINQEQPTVVAQRLRPLIRESAETKIINAKTYEPKLYAVDVFIPKPVPSAFIPMGKVEENHKAVEVPAPQYNSILKAMNSHLGPEAITDLFVRGMGGTVPLLPTTELVEIVPPVPSAFAQASKSYRTSVAPRGPKRTHSPKGKSSKHRRARR